MGTFRFNVFDCTSCASTCVCGSRSVDSAPALVSCVALRQRTPGRAYREFLVATTPAPRLTPQLHPNASPLGSGSTASIFPVSQKKNLTWRRRIALPLKSPGLPGMVSRIQRIFQRARFSQMNQRAVFRFRENNRCTC